VSVFLCSDDDTAGAAAATPAARAEPEVGVAPPGGEQRDDDDAGGSSGSVPARRVPARRAAGRPSGRQHFRPRPSGRAPARLVRAARQHVHPAELPDQFLHLLRHEPAVPRHVLRTLRSRAVLARLAAVRDGRRGDVADARHQSGRPGDHQARRHTAHLRQGDAGRSVRASSRYGGGC